MSLRSSAPPHPATPHQASNSPCRLAPRKPRTCAATSARFLPAACLLTLVVLLPALVFYERRAGAQAGSLVVSVTATVPVAGPQPGVFTITRAGDTSQPLKVAYSVTGTAAREVDYTLETSTSGVPASEFEPPFAAGKVGKALSLNGMNQFVQIPDSPSLRLASLTIEGWINFSGLNFNQVIAGKTVNETTDANSYVLYYFDGKLRGVACKNFDCGNQVTFDFAPQAGVWYHVAFTYEAATNQQKLYLNGAHMATNAGNGVPDYDWHSYLIGASDEFERKAFFFPGRLDEITLYNRALSAAELQAIFNADGAGKCKPGAEVANCVAPPAGIVSWVTGDGNITDLKSVRSPFEPGKVAQGFLFSGGRADVNGGQYVEYRHNPNQDPTAEATLDAWVYFTQLPSERGRTQHIIGKAAPFRFLDLLAFTDDRIHFFIGAGSSVSSNTVVERGRWYHVAATYKANTELKIYVDGVLEKTQAISETRAANENPLTIGNSLLDRSRLFHGLIDEAQMYNRALTAAEVQAIFNAGTAGLCKPVVAAGCAQPPAGLVGWWPGDGHTRDLVTGARGTVIGYDDLLVGQGVTFPAGQSSVTVNVRPLFSPNSAGKTVVLTVLPDLQNSYAVDDFRSSATVALRGPSESKDVSLSSVAPNKGGNTGNVTPVIYGFGFKPGVTVKLARAGEPDIVAAQTTPAADELSVAATFDLNGKAQGVYDVVVANAGGMAKTLTGAFTIEQATPARLSVRVISREVLRIGSEYNVYVLYGNSGNTDVTDAPLWVGVPNFVSIVPDTNQPFEVVPIEDKTYIKVKVPVVRAGSGQSPDVLTVKVKVANPNDIHRIFRSVGFIFNPQFEPSGEGGIAAVGKTISVGSAEAFEPTLENCGKLLGTIAGPGFDKGFQAALIKELIDAGGGEAYVQCQELVNNPEADEFLDNFLPPGDADEAIKGALGQGRSGKSQGQTSNDPNEKAGVSGAGASGYITGGETLPYTIYFENLDTASLPAQDVFITDQLDPTKVDLSTFSFSVISFGHRRFTPPTGQYSFVGYVDLRPEKNLLVKITASMNPATGLVAWTFNSLDPSTGKAPDDPFAGFLPPNKTSPEGQGGVTFNVTPKADLATDTPVTNTARIVFDVNAPIDTNVHLNTIDKTPPASSVSPLAAAQPAHSFEVRWSGADAGSGVRSFNISVSENGGPFTPWQTGTKDTSAIFYGRANSTYRFYSIARDLVGNFETTKTVAEATTLTPAGNPIDESRWFVRQHYLDFLNREPDAPGLQFWTNEIESCGADAQCREVKRVNVSAAFFLSIEFQNTGFLVYRMYKAAYGDATSPNVPGTVPVIRRQEFLPDTQQIGQGVVVLAPGWELQLEANKQAFALEFVQRQRFLTAYPLSMTPAEFVDKLNQNAGGVLPQAERDQLVSELSASSDVAAGRAGVLRKVAESQPLQRSEFNRAFVLMQYYGYLRRNPDDPQDTDFRGWKFWLDKLNSFGGNFVQAEMVKAFNSSIEYRNRFGQ